MERACCLLAAAKSIVLLSVVAVCFGASQATAEVIDTSPFGGGAGSWGPAGGSYGQTFTVPTGDTALLNYTFHILSLNGTFPFVSQIYAWNGDAAVGPAIYTSDVLETPEPGNIYVPYTFTPAVVLEEGQQYILVVTNYPDGISLGGATDSSIGGQMALGGGDTFANPYAGGKFTFSYGGEGYPDPARSLWSTAGRNMDTLFRAEFAPALAWLLDGLRAKAGEVAKVGTSLVDKVELTQAYYDAADVTAACVVMDDFLLQIAALTGKKKLSDETATELSTDAMAVMVAMGCD